MLFERGVNFADFPAWQKRGIALWRTGGEPRSGFNPVTGASEASASYVVHVERELPLGEEYRQLVRRILSEHADRPASAPAAWPPIPAPGPGPRREGARRQRSVRTRRASRGGEI
jgi:hypothetical protein